MTMKTLTLTIFTINAVFGALNLLLAIGGALTGKDFWPANLIIGTLNTCCAVDMWSDVRS